MATTTVTKVTLPFNGDELVAVPSGTGNANVDSKNAPVVALYNPADPTTVLGDATHPVNILLVDSTGNPLLVGTAHALYVMSRDANNRAVASIALSGSGFANNTAGVAETVTLVDGGGNLLGGTSDATHGGLRTMLVTSANTELGTTSTPLVVNTPFLAVDQTHVTASDEVAVYADYASAAMSAVTTDPVLTAQTVDGFVAVSVQITTNAGDSLTWQVSNDNATWVGIALSGSNVTQSAPVLNTTTTGMWSGSLRGAKYFRISHTSGTNPITGVVRFLTMQDLAPSIGGAVQLSPAASSGNAPTTQRVVSAATSTNPTSIKASNGILFAYDVTNTAATARYLKFYNTASAPTVGTTVPLFTILLPPTSHQCVNFGGYGTGFSTGIALAITTGFADTDVGQTAVNDVFCTVAYK